MKLKDNSHGHNILPVTRNKKHAKHFYDRISRIYDYLAGAFERKYVKMAIQCLAAKEGEVILEIGFGTGYCLKLIAESVGNTGKVYGIDISPGMMDVTRRKLDKAHLTNRVELYRGDAVNLPYDENTMDGVFMSFTLELFDTPEIPKVLEETKRVLKPGGRIAVVSMSKQNGDSLSLQFYEWIHRKWPIYADCRPIYLEQYLRDAGYRIKTKEKAKLFGLPIEIVLAT